MQLNMVWYRVRVSESPIISRVPLPRGRGGGRHVVGQGET